jgi:hypothetical protein
MLKQGCFTDWLAYRLEEELPFIHYLIEDWPRESNLLVSYLTYADQRLHCKGSDTWDIICFLWATYAYETLEQCDGPAAEFQDVILEARYRCYEALASLGEDRHDLKLNLIEYIEIMDEEIKNLRNIY